MYINFRGIGFHGFYGLALDDHSNHINIEHCYFTDCGSSALDVRTGSYDIRISSTGFYGGGSAIALENGTQEIEVQNNVFNQNSGIVASYSRNVIIDGNQFNKCQSGISIQSTRNSVIRNNRLDILAQPYYENKGILLINNDTLSVYNNYIYTEGNLSSIGIYMNSCSNTGIYFNSLNIANTDIGGESIGFKMQDCIQDNIKDNIFNIKTVGYPAWIVAGTTGFSLDYNDYYSPSGLIGRYADTNYTNLQEWRQVTGQDGHSLAENPFYTSATNLAMNQVLLNNQGIPVEGILYDIDSTLRNATQPDPGAKEYNPCQLDAGINRITAPTSPVGQGVHEVKVILQNQGLGILSSVIINWKVNGIVQPPYTWSGALPLSGNTEVSIGSYTFTSGLVSIETWTSQPNGSGDCNLYNDSTFTEVAASLCGAYTIGGSNPDFATFTDAVAVLNAAGISCPVVFNVRDGEYNEQFVINDIAGSSEVNTVTFQSESGDSTAVMLRYNGVVVNLKHTMYINFRGIGFHGFYGLALDDHSNHINIEHCYFTDCGSSALDVRTGSYDIRISSTGFYGGGSAIALENGTQEIEVQNNVFNQNSGIVASYSRNVIIDGNQFNKCQSGISIQSTRNSVIRNNRLDILAQPYYENKGILLINNDTLSVYNNYIYTEGNLSSIGIYMNSCSNTGIYFNSLNIANTDIGGESIGFKMQDCIQDNIKDNIFNIKTVGYPAWIVAGTTGFSLDYNDYYSPSGLIGRYADINYTNLQEWGQAVNGDANSKNLAPLYASDTNPLPYQKDLNGAGIPIGGILFDINGKIRNDQAPDIGAVEFMVDFGITQLISPNLDCVHGSADSVTVYLRQFGDVPFKDLRLAYQVNGGTIFMDTIVGTIYNDLIYTFKTPVNISIQGVYLFRIWLINTRDDNLNNDTLVTTRYTKPAPEVDFTYNNQCTGLEFQFSGTATIIDPYFIVGYEWSFGDGDTSHLQNPVHIFPQAGTYPITLKAYSNAGCYNEITKMVVAEEYETLQLQFITKNETCNNSCNGEVNIVVVGGEAPIQLYFNNELITQPKVSNLCPGTYPVRAVDNKGCETSANVTIQTESPMTIGIVADPMAGYAPLNVSLTAQGTGAVSYEWYYKGSLFDTNPTTNITLSDPGIQVIELRVNSGPPNYCILSDTVRIQVNDTLRLEINVKNEVCTNSCNGEADIIVHGGEPPIQLFFNNELVTPPKVSNICAGTYLVRAIDKNGLETSDNVTIITESPMTIGITADPIKGFAPLDVNLSAQGTGSVSYEWYYKDKLFSNQPTSNIRLTDMGVNIIKLIVNSGPPNNCILIDSVLIDVEVDVEINIPNAFTPNGDGYNDSFGPVTKCIESLEMNISDRNGRFIHKIDSVNGRWNGNMPSGSAAPQGVYYYLFKAMGYDDQEYIRQGSVNLYRDIIDLTPNPVKSKAVIDLSGRLSGNKTISINNALGILLRIWNTTEDIINLDLSFLGAGLYILKINDSEQVIVVKFIKE